MEYTGSTAAGITRETLPQIDETRDESPTLSYDFTVFLVAHRNSQHTHIHTQTHICIQYEEREKAK